MTGLTDFMINRKAVSWMVTLLLLVGGVLAFLGLGRLEDPNFTIKQAIIITEYPGASPQEVEEEVTLPIENVIQQLPYVKYISSISSAGTSQVTVEMKGQYRKDDLAQIWDEMRRKIRDMQRFLPPGAAEPFINDDFSDVFGMYFAITGEGYEYEELADYVDFLRRELVLVDGVGKVNVSGRQQEQIYLDVNRTKLTSLNLSLASLQNLLQSQNLVSEAGRIQAGSEYIRISSTGSYDAVEDLQNLKIGQANGQIIYLSDVASIRRGYATPTRHLYRFDGDSALTLGISFASGVNVVEVGDAVNDRLAALEYARPIGMEVDIIYDQPALVAGSINDFLVSLAQAVGIVIVVLLVFMGLRSGILMSLILVLTILGTFIGMQIQGIELHRISLGALVIALGMLVDNAIVITEGILIGQRRGLKKLEAAKRIISQTVWPLLGATIISVVAFAPIGLSPDVSGEFAGSLFYVLLISLMISWVMAITLTPFFADLMFKETGEQDEDAEPVDPYKGIVYQIYKALLLGALRFRYLTVIVMLGALGGAIYGFGFVNQAFFPNSNLPMVLVDYWLPEGSDIRATSASMEKLEDAIQEQPGFARMTTSVGQGALRFMLPYNGERQYSSYGQYIVELDTGDNAEAFRVWLGGYMAEHAPEAFVKSERIKIGPGTKAKIEARISGPDPAELRRIAKEVENIYHAHPDAINIRHDWRERSKVLRPQFAEAEARRLGISKSDLDTALVMNANGVTVGLLRDGSTLLPIVLQQPAEERSNVADLGNVQIYSPALNRYVNIDQVTRNIALEWEDPLIMRRDRKRTIQVWADPDPMGQTNAFALFEDLAPQVEAIELPPGYELDWGGEFEAQQDANQAVFAFVPHGVVAMIAITILLFNSFKQTLVVWLTVPLSVVGVTVGLLVFDQPFAFTALLGFLSLVGMVLKNGIVLVEEIKLLAEGEGKSWHDAITDAAVSRMRPVMMAAITTVLGLIPLLPDVFFAPLAVTIMFGLGFATVLTLIVVPVMFALFYGVKYGAHDL